MKKRINGISSAMLTTAPTVRTNVKQCIMKQFYLKVIGAFIFTVMLPLSVQAYLVPELMYYKFNNAGGNTVANAASSPVGTNPAPVVNLTMGGVGQFGSALIGSGGTPLPTTSIPDGLQVSVPAAGQLHSGLIILTMILLEILLTYLAI